MQKTNTKRYNIIWLTTNKAQCVENINGRYCIEYVPIIKGENSSNGDITRKSGQ
jgi:hypothetical protein